MAVGLSERRRAPAARRARAGTAGAAPHQGLAANTLEWEFEVVESRYPYGFVLIARHSTAASGVPPDGPDVDIAYDWRLRAQKPLLRQLSFLMKPLFEANHRWAMAQGEESLKLELARRRASSDAARARIPPPPGPVTYAAVALLGGAAAIGGALVYLIRRSRRRSA